MTEAPFLPFARPCLSEETYSDVEAVLRSGWLTTGPRVQQFEKDLSAYFSGRAARCVSSATAGLQLSLLAIGLEPGDEVITTPLTFVATLNTIVQAGGKPVHSASSTATPMRNARPMSREGRCAAQTRQALAPSATGRHHGAV